MTSLVATSVAFGAGKTEVLPDGTYVWRGGRGAWTDAAMWRSNGSGDTGYPTAGCTAVFTEIDSDVTLSGEVKLDALTVDTAGVHAFRSDNPVWTRQITPQTVAVTGSGGGSLVLDGVVVWQDRTFPAGFRKVALLNRGKTCLEGDGHLSVTLLGRGYLYSHVNGSYGALRVGHGLVSVQGTGSTRTFSFASFEDLGEGGFVRVNDGTVSFRDPSGVVLVGGSDTLARPGPQIPVAPQFALSAETRNSAWGACTLDSDGVIRAIPTSTMLPSFEGATENDNVYLSENATLTRDLTVNAVVYGACDIDLGGHTLTVKSGVFRPSVQGVDFNHVVSNGTVRVMRPALFSDTTPNADVRMKAGIATAGNDDATAVMAVYVGEGAPPAVPSADLADFTGCVIWTGTALGKATTGADVSYDLDGGVDLKMAGHQEKCQLGGLLGHGEVFLNMFNNVLNLGARVDDFETGKWLFVVGAGGVLEPGYLCEDGGRRGRIAMTCQNERFRTVRLCRGGQLRVSIHADGSSSFVDASKSTIAGEFLDVTLGGDLIPIAAGRIKTRGPWAVLKSGKPTTGFFENAGERGNGISGWKVAYNVPLADGTYAVMVEKKSSGFTVRLR